MLRLLYNYKTKPGEKYPIVDNSNLAMKDFAHATKAGEWIVDLVPWLRHVPEWVPGAGFQKTAKIYRDHLMHSVEDPYNYVRGQMAKGQDDVSYVAGLVQDIHRQIDPEEESVISWTATSMLNAGTDTTAASDVVFGFGRRACPGSAIAEQTLYLSIVQSLAVFSIHKGVDEQGQEMEVEYEMLPGLISRVKPFSCGFAVRSEDHRRLIQ